LLAFSSVIAQKPDVVVNKIEQRTFKGFVDKYPITMTLNVDTFSNQHDSVYSVKGWYVYDNKQIKIPLVGIYDGDLTLYSFKDKDDEKEILSVGNNWDGNIWDRLDQLKMKESYAFSEHFSFQYTPGEALKREFSGTWQNTDGELDARLTGNNLAVFEQEEYLTFDDENIVPINLYKHDIFATNFTFDSWYKDKDEIRVLLHYAFHSTPNYIGMCGGAFESGFVIVHLDDQYRFASSERIPIESCLDSLYAEMNSKNSDIYTQIDSNRKKTKLRIDRKTVKITKL
jgi:hypothetical protein